MLQKQKLKHILQKSIKKNSIAGYRQEILHSPHATHTPTLQCIYKNLNSLPQDEGIKQKAQVYKY